MPRHILEGPLEVDGPTVNYDQAVTRVSQFHTDLLAAQARISSECYNLKLQQVTPIPNIQLYGAFQHDDTTPLSDFSSNVQVGLPIPVFDRNQGNITAAYAQVVRAQQNLEATRNQLLGTLAEAHNRYDSNRQIAISYRADLLQDQVRVYRGVYERFRAVGQDVDFAQVIVAQQSLGQVITGYLQALNDQWQAAVDLAEVMQVDDFYSLSTEAPVVTVPTGVGTAAN